MNTRFREFQPADTSELTEMVFALYAEDIYGEPMNPSKILQTIDFMVANPNSGRIIVFEADQLVVGYSILVSFWSNEFGGLLLYVDELFVKKAFRNQKIGARFFDYLASAKHIVHKGVFLEVSTENVKAAKFYLDNGFEKHGTEVMTFIY